STSGRAPSLFAPSSSWTSTLRASGKSTATTFSPTPGRKSATPTRRPTPCSGCARKRRAASAIPEPGNPSPSKRRIDGHGRRELLSYRRCHGRQTSQAPGVRGVREDRRGLGPPPHLPAVRHDALLRRLAEPPRD